MKLAIVFFGIALAFLLLEVGLVTYTWFNGWYL